MKILVGIIIAAVVYGANQRFKETLKEVYKNNSEISARLEVFGYPIYLWIKNTYFTNKGTDNNADS